MRRSCHHILLPTLRCKHCSSKIHTSMTKDPTHSVPLSLFLDIIQHFMLPVRFAQAQPCQSMTLFKAKETNIVKHTYRVSSDATPVDRLQRKLKELKNRNSNLVVGWIHSHNELWNILKIINSPSANDVLPCKSIKRTRLQNHNTLNIDLIILGRIPQNLHDWNRPIPS